MTANIRIRENRKIPHTCDPDYDFKDSREANPGDLWECPHGHIWVVSLAISLYVWSEIYREIYPIRFWRARRALARAKETS